jgi:hypothetical protein
VPKRPHRRRGSVLTTPGNTHQIQTASAAERRVQPSAWNLRTIKAQHIALTAEDKVYRLDASDLITSESFFLYQAGGVIRSSTLRTGPSSGLSRFNDLMFDKVTWTLDPDDKGTLHGLRPTAQHGDPCTVTFRENTFLVTGNPTAGEIITSGYSTAEPNNRVTVTVAGCTYPEAFGRSRDMPIARALERGDWTFALRDLGDRDPAIAIMKGSQPDAVLHLEPSALTDPIAVPAAYLDRAVYVAVAGARDDAETDILAGVAQQIVVQRPNVSTAQLRDAIIELRDAIAAKRPARQADFARDSALLISRLLTRVVPGLTSPILRTAARHYTRAFLNSYRRSTSSLRQVAPIDLQFDRFSEVERFRRETWQRLHDQARTRPAVAEAIDGGPIAEALGVRTTQNTATLLGLVELEPLATFIAGRTQPGGGILVTRADIHGTLAGTVNLGGGGGWDDRRIGRVER